MLYSGKSTLIKLILGEITPQNGVINVNSGMNIAVFTQHHVDSLKLGLTALEQLKELFPTATEVECRKTLGRFGLTGGK